jgi:hypothetical protein
MLTRRERNRDLQLSIARQAAMVLSNPVAAATGAAKTAIGAKAIIDAAKMGKQYYDKVFKEVKKPIKKVERRIVEASQDRLELAPVSKGYTMISRAPRLRNSSGKVYTVKHRELVTSAIPGSTSFAQQLKYSINPGLASPFLWLSSIANQYEQWNGSVKFCYVPTASTATSGEIMMFADYNVYDADPTTEAQALDHAGAVSAPVWTSNCLTLDAKAMFPTGPKKYVRSQVVAGDRRLYDGANFYFYTNNCGSTATIGKLFVEYSINLYVPQSDPASSAPTNTTEIALSTQQNLTTNDTTNIAFDTIICDGLGIGSSLSGGVITIPPGSFKVTYVSTYFDNVAEANAGILELKLGNAVVVPSVVYSATEGSTYATIQGNAVISTSVATTLQVLINITGASGTLLIPAHTAWLIISPA